MREIKYRAQDYSNTWHYGCVVVGSEGSVLFPVADGGLADLGFHIYVLPETVGQFTGLHDKDGREIYEGDVVECVSWNEFFSQLGRPMEAFRRLMYVEYRRGAFRMVEHMPQPMTDNEWDLIFNGDIVVVGNIHDNPELLRQIGNYGR